MSPMVTLCLGIVILAFLIPSQVHSQSTPKNNATSVTVVGQNASVSSNSSGVSPVTTSTNTTTPHGHADSLYLSSALFISMASICLLNLCC